jgi:hypothetical protein
MTILSQRSYKVSFAAGSLHKSGSIVTMWKVHSLVSMPIFRSRVWTNFLLHSKSGIPRRRCLVTEHGSVGAAPVETMVSDLVCVLFGCSVPVILRPIADADEFRFIGECYVNGLMDGEAIAGLETGEFLDRDFVLK